jgi:hypothetical protein
VSRVLCQVAPSSFKPTDPPPRFRAPHGATDADATAPIGDDWEHFAGEVPLVDLLRARQLCARLWRALSVAVFLLGLGFAAYAGVQWLETAHWQPLTIDGALASWPTTRDWIAHPHSWLGLHRIVVRMVHVPVFLVVTLLGGALLLIGSPPTRRRRSTGDFG